MVYLAGLWEIYSVWLGVVRKRDLVRLREYMYKKFRNYLDIKPRLSKVVGWVFIVFGILAAILPLVPGAILFFIGLEVLGIRLAFFDRFRKSKTVPGEVAVINQVTDKAFLSPSTKASVVE